MKLRIEIDLENAAFHGDDATPLAGDEAGRILFKLAKDIALHPQTLGDRIRLYDSNGNTVGKAEVIE